MRQKSDLIVVKEFSSRDELLKFLNELDKEYNLDHIIQYLKIHLVDTKYFIEIIHQKHQKIDYVERIIDY